MDRAEIYKELGEAAVLELLAEECAELAHAALKLARIRRGENPTPVSVEDAERSVLEEMADVILVKSVLVQAPWYKGREMIDTIAEKQTRWENRMNGHMNGHF